MVEPLIENAQVIVSERVPLQQATLSALLETITAVMRGEFRVVGLTYRRGEDLIVERQVPTSHKVEGTSFRSPYQDVRLKASIRLFEDGDYTPVERLCRAAMLLHEKRMPAIAIVTRSPAKLQAWLGGVKAEQVLRVPLLVDPDAPDKRVFICGALSGTTISDVEYAVVCQME